MKRILPLIILISSLSFYGFMFNGGRPPSDLCTTMGASGTYEHWWNGQYSGDTDKACQDSGAAQIDGTDTGGTIVDSGGGDYVARLVNSGDNIDWTTVPSQTIDEAGTVEFELTTPAAITGVTVLFEIYQNGDNHIICRTRNTEPDIQCLHKGSGTSRYVDSGAIGTSSTFTVMYSCRASGTEKHCVSIDGGNNWTCSEVDLNPFAGSIGNIAIGDKNTGLNINDQYDTDDFQIREGYEGS